MAGISPSCVHFTFNRTGLPVAWVILPAGARIGAQRQQETSVESASVLMFTGLEQPSGYTEPLLHAWRLKVKAAA